ncbi:hypothetical protein [Serratia ureilytica]|uniref:hypothetical protein n=1 Tax=Serratia ureilytica TaxID=300181 RepID=UPI00313AF12F
MLTRLPENIGELTALRSLDLRANRLSDLPESLGELSRLRKLDLRWNDFTHTPNVIEILRARGCMVHI